MKINHLIYKAVLVTIFVYATLRAFFVTPLFDEAATFLHYIIPGNGWNPGEYADANNHILISLFGSFCLELGFDHPFFMRIPSLIGFLIYGFALHQLFVKQLKIPFAHLIVICTYSIPWVLEYGALARGYGFSIGCYIALIVLLIEFTKQTKIVHFLLFFTLAWLTILSSFTFTVPVFLLLVVSFVFMLSTLKTQSRKHIIYYFLLGGLFLAAYIPLFTRAMVLKESGALWWGSSIGLWDVTGTSISTIVLFSKHWLIRILLNAITLIAAILWINKLISTKPKEWFTNPFLWLNAYIFGLLLALIVLAKLFKMNYPMDRVGMYLVPLFVILFVFICTEIKQLKYATILLTFLPITFLVNANLKYTIFSPQDLVTDETYGEFKKITKKGGQASAEWMIYINYLYKSRTDKQKNIIALAPTYNQTDYFFNYLTKPSTLYNGYELSYIENHTQVGIYKKKAINPKQLIHTITIQPFIFEETENYFINLDSLDQALSTWSNKPFSFKIEGLFDMINSAQVLKLVVEATDNDGNQTTFSHTNLHHTFYPQKHFDFTLSSLTFQPLQLKNLKFRLENPFQKEINVKKLKVTFFNEGETYEF